MMTSSHFLIVANTTKANTHHDPLNGQFTSGDTGVSRATMTRLQEHRDALKERGERRQPSSGVLILPEREARQQGQSVNDNLDVKSSEAMQMASRETAGSRVFKFSQGDGSDLDRNVRMVTNTNSSGTFERGALRVEIFDPDTQKRHVYQRKMSELPMLVRQVIQKRYSSTSQHRRNSANVVKAAAATKWVTLPSGARIPIGGSGGANQQSDAKPKESAPKPARNVEAQESQGNAGEGLTHAQRTQIVNKLSEKLGIDPATVTVSETDREDENGKVAGDYDPATKQITIYPEGFSQGKEELTGTLLHEAQHAKMDAVIGAYNEQRKLFEGGESLQSEKVSVFKELKPVFTSERATYALADGFNKYSTMFWDRYKANPSTSTYVAAINESMAEAARLVQAGQGGDISQQMMSLYNKVNQFAKG